MVVTCPICGKEVKWQDSPYRPFCTQRCKLTDLGKWADGEYRIAAGPLDEKAKNGEPPDDTEED
ncbi:MAG: DNA gyrase inhibitor YacG [Nitrospirae bacterium YQR-1]